MRRLLALAAVILLAAPAVLATHPEDDRPHVQSRMEFRDVRVDVGDETVRYTLKRPSEPLRDTLSFRFDGATGELRWEHREHESLRESTFGVTLVLDRLVEFRDENNNHRYDEGIDPAFRTFSFTGMSWRTLDVETRQVQGVDTPYTAAIGSFGAGGEFSIEFYANGRAVDVGEATLHPQDVKMFWNVANFPFSREDTRFAIVLRVITDDETTVTGERNADAMLTTLWFEAPNRFAFFDWADHAIGNSTGDSQARRLVFAQMPDTVTRHDDGAIERALVLTYPRADFLISHDPVMGMEYAYGRPPFLGLPMGLILGVAGFVGVAWGAWWAQQPKGRARLITWRVQVVTYARSVQTRLRERFRGE